MGRRDQLVAAGDPALHEVHELRAGPGGQGDLRGGGERVVVRHRVGGGPGADHADPAVAGGGHRAPGGGVDHLDDGYVVPLAGVAEHRGAGAVARDDQRLHVLVDQVVEALEGVLADLADRLGAVGLPRRVADVQDRLVGQLVDHGPGHGESTEARVEDADRSIRHDADRLVGREARPPAIATEVTREVRRVVTHSRDLRPCWGVSPADDAGGMGYDMELVDLQEQQTAVVRGHVTFEGIADFLGARVRRGRGGARRARPSAPPVRRSRSTRCARTASTSRPASPPAPRSNRRAG